VEPRQTRSKSGYQFHTVEHRIYFSLARRPAKEIGRLLVYDGPLDSIGPRDAASHTTAVFIDHTSSPPMLELRDGSCLFGCAPRERYRYDGKLLQRIP
jgi:hypothetical protein